MNLFRKTFFLFFLIGILAGPLRAQSTGEWIGAGLNLDLPKGFSFKVTNSERFLNTGLGLYKYLFQFEAGYHINKYFDAALIYRTAWRIEKDDAYHYRDKLMAELHADLGAGRFKFENRLRYQRRTKTYIKNDYDLIPLHHIRDKITVKYNIRKSKFTPDLFFEAFFPLNSFATKTVDEYRVGADLRYKFSKKHAVKGGIMMQNGVVGFPIEALWFRFSYTYTIKI